MTPVEIQAAQRGEDALVNLHRARNGLRLANNRIVKGRECVRDVRLNYADPWKGAR